MDENTDLQTMDQHAAIQKEITESQPLIGEQINVDELMDTYKDADLPGFVPGIEYLSKVCSSMRKVRGDGNCFYRAFLFGYLDILVKTHERGDDQSITEARTERDRVLLIARGSMAELMAVGYEEFAIDSFHEVS